MSPLGTTRKCEICGWPTAELKPFCFKHLTMNPEAGRASSELKRREKEIEEAASPDGSHLHIAPDSSVIDDVMAVVINESGATVEKISQATRLPLLAAERYVEHLRSRDMLFKCLVRDKQKRKKIVYRHVEPTTEEE